MSLSPIQSHMNLSTSISNAPRLLSVTHFKFKVNLIRCVKVGVMTKGPGQEVHRQKVHDMTLTTQGSRQKKGSPTKGSRQRFTPYLQVWTGSWINENNSPYVFVDENDVLSSEIEAGWIKLIIDIYIYIYMYIYIPIDTNVACFIEMDAGITEPTTAICRL